MTSQILIRCIESSQEIVASRPQEHSSGHGRVLGRRNPAAHCPVDSKVHS